MKAIILAAGYATRLYPLTQNRPKALLPIANRTIMDYLFDEISRIPRIDEAILVSNHRFADQFVAWAQTAQVAYPKIRIRVLDDGTTGNENRLGAIGDIDFAIRQAEIDDELFVAVSDNLFTFHLTDFVADYLHHGCDTLLAKPLNDVDACRRFAIATLDDQRRVLSLVEKPEHPQSNLAVYGLYLYRRDTLPLIAQYLAEGNNPDSPGHFPEWLYQRREVRAYLFDGECIDIGTVEAYRAVCEEYKNRNCPA